jgi:glycosyltransferase involved in cell wall biosynthesis
LKKYTTSTYFSYTLNRLGLALEKRLYVLLNILARVLFEYTRKKKIVKVFVIADFEKFGGTRTYLLQLLKFYHDEQKEVTVLVKRNFTDSDMETYVKNLGFNYYVLDSKSYVNASYFVSIYRLIEETKDIGKLFFKLWPDLIVVTTAGYFNLLSSIALPTRFIYILHSYPRETLPYYYKRLLRLHLSNFKKIITVSQFSKNKLIEYWELSEFNSHIHVVYNSICKALGQEPVNRTLMTNNSTLKVITLGHVVDYKNPLAWIEIAKEVIAMNQEKKIEFLWIGDGELLNFCRGKIAEEGLKNIYFLGYSKDVDSFYTEAVVYLQPSLIESFGLSVLEAMYYRLPSVVSDIGGLPELIVNGKTGFVVNVEKNEEMVNKVNILLNNRDLRLKIGESAHKVYLDKFSYESWRNNMLSILETIL